jgi:hypothetical protein
MAVIGTRLMELAEELADTPTLSAYVSTNAARRRGATHGVWQIEVAEFTRELRLRYGDVIERTTRDAFERNLRRLELRLRGLPHALRAPGWFIVVARGDVHYCAPMSHAAASEARWQRGPWLSLLFSPTVNASQVSPFLLTPAEH